MNNRTFVSDSSELFWKMFKETGNIGYYMLFSHIENPPKELIYVEEEELTR